VLYLNGVGLDLTVRKILKKKASNYKLFGLLRFFLAVFVAVSHARDFASPATANFLKPLALGTIAVFSFFVLSGFIITEALNVFYYLRPRAFLINRFIRIVPPYILALVLSIVGQYYLSKHFAMSYLPGDQLAVPPGMFTLKNYLLNLTSIFVPSELIHLDHNNLFVRYVWAVRVEFHFYLVSALAFTLIWLKERRPYRVIVSVLAVAACLVLEVVVSKYPSEILREILSSFYFTPYFLIGISLYYLRKARDQEKRRGVLLGLLAAAGFLSLSLAHFAQYSGSRTSFYIGAPIFAAICLTIYLLSGLKRTSFQRYDRIFGDISYPLYLNHQIVLLFAWNLIGARNWVVFLLAIVAAVVFSAGAGFALEPFLQRARDKIRGVKLR